MKNLKDSCFYRVFVATPGPFELTVSGNNIVEQVIRPTGLVDPQVYMHPTAGQIDHLVDKINEHKKRGERTLVLALTKKTAEDLSAFFTEKNIKTRYLHSDIEALDRVEILKEFRQGKFDVLVGINLLREGIDIPQVGWWPFLGLTTKASCAIPPLYPDFRPRARTQGAK